LIQKLHPKGDALSIANFTARESFSRAKPRYTEASLVKKIEEMGIGRPSTFATMVSTFCVAMVSKSDSSFAVN
jgi:DNA topoisomerase IA